jgi:hypothetical protein
MEFKAFFRNFNFNRQLIFLIAIVNIICLEQVSFAYIPPTKMILHKVTENSGAGPYAIEQLVEFSQGLDPLMVRENWVIENDHSMRLTVTGEKSLKNSLKLQFVYAGAQRWAIENGTRTASAISREQLQRFFHFKNTEALASFLLKEQILPNNYLVRKTLPAKSSEIMFQPESWVRLARLGGVVNWAFGSPSSDTELMPGLWIEQDQFVIRKIRLGTQAEITAEGYKEFSKGLLYPEKQSIKWNNNSVSIRLVSVKSLQAKSFQSIQPSSLDNQNHTEGLNQNPSQTAVTEFYSRFR